MSASWQRLVAELGTWSAEAWLHAAEVAAVVLAAWVGWRQLSHLRRQLRDDHRRARRQQALAYSIVNADHLRDARRQVDAAFSPEANQGRPIPAQTVLEALRKDQDLRMSLIVLLAHWENLALTIAADATDEDVAFEMVAGTLVDYVHRLGDYIQTQQAAKPRAYLYLIRLAERWQSRLDRQKSPRRLFPL